MVEIRHKINKKFLDLLRGMYMELSLAQKSADEKMKNRHFSMTASQDYSSGELPDSGKSFRFALKETEFSIK